MKTIALHNGEKLPVIGFGTWTIGGRMSPDRSQDDRGLSALRHALKTGYTHFDTAEMYGAGHSEELLGAAIQEYDRSKLFITTKVQPGNLNYHGVHRSLDASLARLGLDYVDLYLIHWPDGRTPLSETFRALNEAVATGKVRHLGVSNFDLAELKTAQQVSNTPIVTNQVAYSVLDREYVRSGIIPYCQQNKIVITAYSPVKEGRLGHTHPLPEIAAAHHSTPYQIALAWLVMQPHVITIPMSLNPTHIEENFAAAAIELTPDEMVALGKMAS